MKIIKKIKYHITIFLIIMTIILCIYLKNKLNMSNKIDEVEDLELSKNIDVCDNSVADDQEKSICTIDIKGAVNLPGVYDTECDKNVNDIINMAGGLLENADTSMINLAKKIKNEMVIIIYTKEEVKNSNVENIINKTNDNNCLCPSIKNNASITENTNLAGIDSSLININTASINELKTLSGIGESKAKAIIEYRDKFGPFKNIDDILNVNGIGNKLYEQIKTHITT